MSVNGITNVSQRYGSGSVTKSDGRTGKSNDAAKQEDVAAVYEKGGQVTEETTVYKQDTATIDRLKAEADRRNQSLRELVLRLISKQGQTVDDATDIYTLLREGKVDVDPETKAQAQKDISEDGYWGVKQTSERICSFAKALAGGDPSKADELIEAVKKGFDEAAKAWGGELPDICQQTYNSAISKLEAWRDGKDSQ